MKYSPHLIIPLLVFISIAFVINQQLERSVETFVPTSTDRTPTVPDCIPTFIDGGGPYYQPNAPFRERIAPGDADGDTLVVSGRVVRNDCVTGIPGAVVDIWQADASGEYRNEWYRGQVETDQDGSYTFTTVVPRGYGEGTGYRPPHIHFKIFENNQEIITSQMFFPEVQGRPGFDDAYIMDLTESTVLGQRVFSGSHDIVLP